MGLAHFGLDFSSNGAQFINYECSIKHYRLAEINVSRRLLPYFLSPGFLAVEERLIPRDTLE
jgi:hypothetical protein